MILHKSSLIDEMMILYENDPIGFANRYGIKQSKYNLAKLFNDNKILLYNCHSESIVLFNQDVYESVFFNSNFSDKVIIEELLLNGFLLCNNIDEDMLCNDIKRKALNQGKNEIKITINPTYQCNANCFYCFEHLSPKQTMSAEVIETVSAWVVNNLAPKDNLTLVWFGGEPLLQVNTIDRIINNIKKNLPQQVHYQSIVISNGTIMDESLCNLLINQWNTVEFHTVIDGLEKEHNERKCFLNKKFNGYKKTIYTIQTMLNYRVPVVCRLNIDKANLHMLDPILQELKQMQNVELLKVFIAPLRNQIESVRNDYYNYEEYNDLFDYAFNLLFKYGFISDIADILPKRKITCCSSKRERDYVIDPLGNIFFCIQTATDKQYSIGNCSIGSVKMTHDKQFSNLECQSCNLIPICQGGCKGFRMLNNGISPCTIEKHYINTLLKWMRVLSEKEKENDNC